MNAFYEYFIGDGKISWNSPSVISQERNLFAFERDKDSNCIYGKIRWSSSKSNFLKNSSDCNHHLVLKSACLKSTNDFQFLTDLRQISLIIDFHHDSAKNMYFP